MRKWIVLLVLFLSFTNNVQAAGNCTETDDCFPVKFTAWCFAASKDCRGNQPAKSCPEQSGDGTGYRIADEAVAWAVEIYKTCEGFVSGTATRAGAE